MIFFLNLEEKVGSPTRIRGYVSDVQSHGYSKAVLIPKPTVSVEEEAARAEEEKAQKAREKAARRARREQHLAQPAATVEMASAAPSVQHPTTQLPQQPIHHHHQQQQQASPHPPYGGLTPPSRPAPPPPGEAARIMGRGPRRGQPPAAAAAAMAGQSNNNNATLFIDGVPCPSRPAPQPPRPY